MQTTEFRLLTPTEESIVFTQESHSIENMKEHGAEDDNPTYIGSKIGKVREDGSADVNDYFKDKQGRLWYKSRKRLQDGRIVSMEEYLFPNHDPKKYKKRPR